MYVYHLYAKMQSGEQLTPQEQEILSGAFQNMENQRSHERAENRKSLGKFAGILALIVSGSIALYGTGKAINSLVKASPTSESTRATLNPERNYLSTLESLEYQAQQSLDRAIQAGIGGNEDLRARYLTDAKQFYSSALELSKTNKFATKGTAERLEKELNGLDSWGR